MTRGINIIRIVLKIAMTVFLWMVIRTVFVISYDYPEAAVTGKFFYLREVLPWGALLAIPVFFWAKRVAFSLKDLFVLLFLGYYIFNYHHHGSIVENRLVSVLLLGNLYFILRIFHSYWSKLLEIAAGLILISGIGEAVLGLKQIYGYAYSYHSLYAVTGSFFNPGPYSGYLAFAFALGLFYTYRKRHAFALLRQVVRDKQTLDFPAVFDLILWCLSTCCTLLCLVLIPATMSRSAWIAVFGTGLVFYLLETGGRQRIAALFQRQKIRWFGISVSVIAIVLVLSFGIYSLKKESADSRLWNWKMTTGIISTHPITGVGPGYYGGAYAQVQADYFRENPDSEFRKVADSPVYAFNEYLQLGAELGIIGLGLFLFVIILCFRQMVAKPNGFHYALIALLIFAVTSYPFRVLPLMILFVFAIAFQSEGVAGLAKKGWNRMVFATILLTGGVFFISTWPEKKQQAESYKEWRSVRMLYQLELYKDAASDYEPLFDALKQERDFLFEYGHALNKAGRYEESNRVLALGTTTSNDPMFYNVMGNNYKALGEMEAADRCYEEAYFILPNRIYPLYLQALLSFEKGDTLEGLARARRVIDFIPKIESSATREMKREMQETIARNEGN